MIKQEKDKVLDGALHRPSLMSGMIVSVNDQLWRYLWAGIREAHQWDAMTTKDEIESALFSKEGIRIICDEIDGRWQAVMLPQGEDLIALILRYGNDAA